MNPETGEIRPEAELTREQRKTWIPIPPTEYARVSEMNRHDRRKWAKHQKQLATKSRLAKLAQDKRRGKR